MLVARSTPRRIKDASFSRSPATFKSSEASRSLVFTGVTSSFSWSWRSSSSTSRSVCTYWSISSLLLIGLLVEYVSLLRLRLEPYSPLLGLVLLYQHIYCQLQYFLELESLLEGYVAELVPLLQVCLHGDSTVAVRPAIVGTSPLRTSSPVQLSLAELLLQLLVLDCLYKSVRLAGLYLLLLALRLGGWGFPKEDGYPAPYLFGFLVHICTVLLCSYLLLYLKSEALVVLRSVGAGSVVQYALYSERSFSKGDVLPYLRLEYQLPVTSPESLLHRLREVALLVPGYEDSRET